MITCGRHAFALEFDPTYCDTIIARWQAYTGKQAILAETGKSFEQVTTLRSTEMPDPNHASREN